MEEGGTAMDTMATTLQPLITAMTSSITPGQIVTVLAAVVGVGMTFVLMWFGARKLKSIFTAAVTRGKIKI